MMKKLLILLLVFGLASAYAADIRDDFQLELRGSKLYVVGLTAGTSMVAGIYDETATLASFSNKATLGDGGGGNAAGALAVINLYSGTGYAGFDITVGDTDPSTDTVEAMDWFSVDVSNLSVGDTVSIYDYNVSSTVAVGTMDIIPEPMTIALLGLGGLFLRRRK